MKGQVGPGPLVERPSGAQESYMPIPWDPDCAGERHSARLGAVLVWNRDHGPRGNFELSQTRPRQHRPRVARILGVSGNRVAAAGARIWGAMDDG